MRRVALLCLLFACGDDGSDGPLPTGPITARITHYDFGFDIDTRAAHAKLALDVTTGGDCLTLPFRAQAPANVLLGGEPATAAVEGEAIKICGSGQRTGASDVELDVTIPLATLSTSQVGYSITKDSEQNAFYYLVSWVGGCDRFGPCDNRSDQFATYKFTVTHPANFKVRCPGTITESGTTTTCDFTHDGGPTYSTFGVAAYPAWTITDKGMWDGVKVAVYDRASTGINAAIDSTYHGGFIAFMQSHFGPYPYGDELRVLTAPTYWSGFEHPGNIVLDDGLAKQTNPLYAKNTAHILDHEIAHMWAGDQTTLASTYDFTWKEAMAEYLSYAYEDNANAADGKKTAGAWKLLAQDAKYFPVPTSMPALFDYYGDAYGPGPMILFRQIEVMVGRNKVLDAIAGVIGDGARAASVDDVIAALKTQSGLDLDTYMAAWLKGSGAPDWPRYKVTFTAGAGTSSLALEMLNKKAQKRGCKFHVALRGGNGEETQVEVDTFAGAEDQTLSVPTPAFTVSSIVLDPLAECLVYLASSTPRTVKRRAWVSDRAGIFAPVD